MKRIIVALALAAILSPIAPMASQASTSAPRPGVSINVTPGGSSIGVSGSNISFVYTTDGYYDGYGRFHHVSHRHPRNCKHCKQCEKEMRKHRKEMEKRNRKASNHRHDHDNRPGSSRR